MASILPFRADPFRKLEAQAMAEVREDLANAGLDSRQIAHAMRTARASFRRRQDAVRPTCEALALRARALQAAPLTLLAALHSALRELVDGRSTACAIAVGNRSMRTTTHTARPPHTAA